MLQDACSDNSAAEDLEALAASAASGKGSGSSKKERLRQAMHRVCQWLKVPFLEHLVFAVHGQEPECT